MAPSSCTGLPAKEQPPRVRDYIGPDVPLLVPKKASRRVLLDAEAQEALLQRLNTIKRMLEQDTFFCPYEDEEEQNWDKLRGFKPWLNATDNAMQIPLNWMLDELEAMFSTATPSLCPPLLDNKKSLKRMQKIIKRMICFCASFRSSPGVGMDAPEESVALLQLESANEKVLVGLNDLFGNIIAAVESNAWPIPIDLELDIDEELEIVGMARAGFSAPTPVKRTCSGNSDGSLLAAFGLGWLFGGGGE